jgi:Domain of unknown function (DUF6597)
MQYRHRVPRPPLDAFIDSIWVYQNNPGPHALERILPTGAAQLIVNLKEDQTRLYDPESPHRYVASSGSVLSGVQSHFQVIDTSEQAEAVLSHPSIPARLGAVASRPPRRLDTGGAGLRLLRSSALHSRLSLLRRPHADRISVSQNVVSEPRQISTIRRRRHLR